MISVVLNEPQDLVNIAHVVRSMKNFGFTDLRLVAPAEYDAWRIEGIAHRTNDILARVQLFDALTPALADCVHVVAFSARGRTAKRAVQRPRAAAAEIMAVAEQGPVALLFGREDKGLDNAALDRAHRVVAIPSDPDYKSMNLGHAVAIALYELALARGDEARPLKPPRHQSPPAPVAQLEQLFTDVGLALDAINFFRRRERTLLMRTVRTLVQRVPLEEREVKLLRSMAIEVRKTVKAES